MVMGILFSDVTITLSYMTKITYIFRPRPRPLFQDQDRFIKDHQIINPSPQKTFPYRKNQANSYAGFTQS